jgi:cytochrome c
MSQIIAFFLALLFTYSIMPSSLSSAKPIIEKGKTIYMNRCQKCHGTTGEGDGPSAEFLSVKPASFKEGKMFIDKEGIDMEPEDRIAMVIRKGGPSAKKSKLMQAYPDLSDQEIQDVIGFLKTLKK